MVTIFAASWPQPRSSFDALARRVRARAAGALATLAVALLALPAQADLAAIGSKEAGAGLKEALVRGAEYAVAQLGKPDGFLGNSKVKIPLPEPLQKVESLGRMLGLSKQADELVVTMNHAAEAAVVEAKPLLVNAVKNMSVKDVYDILGGPPDAATRYFQKTTSDQLTEKFLPIVHQATTRVSLSEKYNAFAGKAAKLKLLDEKDADLDGYVTRKALDGLFLMIAEQEKQIREDPVGSGSKLLQKVFGAIGG
ncbi:conserved exported protein of unknown function [Sterolibacterium denitrificans]|uniref:DUF4197 domain-containing protein n=1 Tax=Sterolibacterium denitrificans TaxID=157592 RepID=A0A7Z7HQC9_9PROT|nr:DUF4197 domain-containing protein [Sterolibacterium denitrificans]SMB24790.1 conserved exported protein of unknown function [Sterolibacterium denitrificans]